MKIDGYLQHVSITGSSFEDAEPLQLPSQQSQHGAVDVIETDARGAQRQAGELDLQNSLVQLGLGGVESAGRGARRAGL